MKYMLMFCLDGIPEAPDVEESIMRDGAAWAEGLRERGVQVLGNALQHASTAQTVRVRNGETIVSAGPFVETREFIGGIDVIDCADLDEAIEIAATHPLARFHKVEVRPFWIDPDDPGPDPQFGRPMRHLLFICADDNGRSDAERETIMREIPGWLDQMSAQDIRVWGHALQDPTTATTVRVREGETLVSDGPFTEGKEFVAGFDILDCELSEAIAAAAKHPLSWFNTIEVRPFVDDARCG